MAAEASLRGVGGWLLFLIICLVAIGPLSGFGNLSDYFENAERITPAWLVNSQWVEYKALSWDIFRATTILSISIGAALSLVHRPITVTLAIIGLWLLWLLTSFGNVAAAAIVSGADPSAALREISGAATGVFITTLLWTIYLIRSRRVRNTFVRGSAPHDPNGPTT